MEVVFIIQDITTQGGTERTTCCLANEFAKHGHHVTIISIFKYNDCMCYEVNKNVIVEYLSNESYSLKLSKLQRITTIINKINYLKTNTTLKEANIIFGQKLLASTLLYLSGYSKKSIACEHFKFEMYNKLIRQMRNWLYKHFLQVVVLTENDKLKFNKSINNVSVIPNMISVPIKENIGANNRRIISVGRLNFQKGYDLLLEALSKIKNIIKDWEIEIYGDGEDYNTLKSQCTTLLLDKNVKFMGFTSNIENKYCESTFYVMSSRFEGFPMVLLEAAACGLPIVSFACPEGPSTLLANGGGLLAKAEDSDDLASKIAEMITNQTLREKFATQTKAVIQPYQPETIYNRWIELIAKILKK